MNGNGKDKSSVIAEMPDACHCEGAALEFLEKQRWGDVPALMPIAKTANRGDGIKQDGSWFHDSNGTLRQHSSKSPKRKFASAMIAKIPYPLAEHIGKIYYEAGKP